MADVNPRQSAVAGSPAEVTSTWHAFLGTLKRDLLIAYKRKNDVVNPFMFFLIVATLFPIGISRSRSDSARLPPVCCGFLRYWRRCWPWDSLYRSDYEDGALEQLLLSPHPLYFMVLAKNIAHWLVSGLPVVLISPLIAYMLALPEGPT